MNRKHAWTAGALLAGALSWYVFVDTLSFSQLLPRPDAPYAAALLNLVDFDTGLTRFDLFRLRLAGERWNRRIQEVEALGDPAERERLRGLLLLEMTEDPASRKILQKSLLGTAQLSRVVYDMLKK